MYRYIILSSTGVAASTGGLHWLNSSDTVFRVRHALKEFGFTVLSPGFLSKECNKWLGYSFYSVSQPEFLNARQKCVKGVRFSDLAKRQNLIPIDPWSTDIKGSNQPDWIWAATIFDQTTSSIKSDLKEYISKDSESSKSNDSGKNDEITNKKTLIETNLSKELEQITDQTKKQEFTKNLASLLVILEYLDKLKEVCWALQYTHHNAEYTDLSALNKDLSFYIKYCTKFSTK